MYYKHTICKILASPKALQCLCMLYPNYLIMHTFTTTDLFSYSWSESP